MGMHKSKAKLKTQRTGGGFSAIELLVTATILTIVSGLGVMGITRARASIRLSGAAREYASYVEKARVLSIRSHADDADQRARVAINDNKISYDITMDLDGDGDMDTKTMPLPEGLAFDDVETIAFDWRGRTWHTFNGITLSNDQVSITVVGPYDSISIDVTGSGDVTIDSDVFDDDLPTIHLRIGDLAEGATPAPTPVTGIPTPTPALNPSPAPDAAASPTPTPGLDGVDPVATPTPSPSPTATATPSPNPAATATPTPRPTPTPLVCSLSLDLGLVIMHQGESATVKVSVTSNALVSLTATSSKPSELQVSPGGSQNVGSGSFTNFTIKAKKAGTYLVTFKSSCDTKVVSVTVLPKLL